MLYLSDALRKNFLSDKFDYKVCSQSTCVCIQQSNISQSVRFLCFHIGVGLLLLPVCYIHQPVLPSARDLLCIKEEENTGKVSACNLSEFSYFYAIYYIKSSMSNE